MQDTEEIIFEGLKLLNKILEKPEPEPEPEEPVMGGGSTEQPQMQAQEVEPDHLDHESHFSFLHEHTQAMIGGVMGTIGLVIVAYLGYKAAQKKKNSSTSS